MDDHADKALTMLANEVGRLFVAYAHINLPDYTEVDSSALSFEVRGEGDHESLVFHAHASGGGVMLDIIEDLVQRSEYENSIPPKAEVEDFGLNVVRLRPMVDRSENTLILDIADRSVALGLARVIGHGMAQRALEIFGDERPSREVDGCVLQGMLEAVLESARKAGVPNMVGISGPRSGRTP